MMNNNRYMPFVLVALVASVLGWGASTFMNRETTNAMTAANNAAALGFQPIQPAASFQPVAPSTLQPVPQQMLVPVAAQSAAPLERVVTVREAPRPIVRTAPVQASPASEPNVNAGPDDAYTPSAPAPTRKKGMSNKAKTAIAIGGAAGVGAAIGGIAKGGKGAAIGAIAGAGAGTVYSVIRNKQNKPIF
jgi:hypothetical protein